MEIRAELEMQLRSTELLLRELAIAALSEGWNIKTVTASIVSPVLITTYSLRAARVKSFDGLNWQELTCSMEEFVENLHLHPGAKAEWLKVQGTEERYFLLYRLADGGPILGCMRVRSSDACAPDEPNGSVVA